MKKDREPLNNFPKVTKLYMEKLEQRLSKSGSSIHDHNHFENSLSGCYTLGSLKRIKLNKDEIISHFVIKVLLLLFWVH